MVLVKTANEILVIADAMEQAAVDRYTTLGACMRRVGHQDLARIFEDLAEEEKAHVAGVQKLSEIWGTAEPSADIKDWVLPDPFEANQAGEVALRSPYKALSIAVRGEERAFAFWTYVASETNSADLRAKAETMARQELIHAARLRHERRRAYHAEKPSPTADGAQRVERIPNKTDLMRWQSEAAAFLMLAARELIRLDDPATARLFRDVADELCLPEERQPPADAQARLARAAIAGPAGILFEAAGTLERLGEHYLDFIGRTADAGHLQESGGQAERVMTALGRLNFRLYELEPKLRELGIESGATKAAGV